MQHRKGIVAVLLLVYVVIVLVATIGWSMNIYKLCKCDFKAPYKAEIMRGIGTFVAPMGAIEGFMTIEDK